MNPLRVYTLPTPCPFCGGIVRVNTVQLMTLETRTEAECLGCGTEFTYSQDFAIAKGARIKLRPSFEELWLGKKEEVKP